MLSTMLLLLSAQCGTSTTRIPVVGVKVSVAHEARSLNSIFGGSSELVKKLRHDVELFLTNEFPVFVFTDSAPNHIHRIVVELITEHVDGQDTSCEWASNDCELWFRVTFKSGTQTFDQRARLP